MRELNIDEIQTINAFENMTGTEVRDCIISEDAIYFLINSGKAALAIGKGGQMVKNAERFLKRPIRIFEHDENPEEFVRKLVPQAEKIEINDMKASVSVNAKERGIVIGKAGSRIKLMNEFLVRNSELKELRIL